MGGRRGNVGKEGTFPRLGPGGGTVQDELYSVVPHSVCEVFTGIITLMCFCHSLVGYNVIVILAKYE